jgi:outer membrane protein TolC
LLNRNRGPIAQAEAERARARAELALTLFQTQATIGRAARQRSVALEKLQRDALLVESANRIVAMSLVAYREGAQALTTVLEAQRNAREILFQYVSDLADAWIASATLRLYGMTVPTR